METKLRGIFATIELWVLSAPSLPLHLLPLSAKSQRCIHKANSTRYMLTQTHPWNPAGGSHLHSFSIRTNGSLLSSLHSKTMTVTYKHTSNKSNKEKEKTFLTVELQPPRYRETPLNLMTNISLYQERLVFKVAFLNKWHFRLHLSSLPPYRYWIQFSKKIYFTLRWRVKLQLQASLLAI